jgi:Tfp pilus assembly protein PilE
MTAAPDTQKPANLIGQRARGCGYRGDETQLSRGRKCQLRDRFVSGHFVSNRCSRTTSLHAHPPPVAGGVFLCDKLRITSIGRDLDHLGGPMYGEEIFDPGEDYQKAKRASFAMSLIAIFLAKSNNKKEIPLTIFGIQTNLPVIWVIFIIISGIIYCGYNFYIQERRAQAKHSKMMAAYKDLNPENALSALEETLSTLSSEGQAAIEKMKEFNVIMSNMNKNAEISIDYVIGSPEKDFISDQYRTSVIPRIKTNRVSSDEIMNFTIDFIDGVQNRVLHHMSDWGNKVKSDILFQIGSNFSQLCNNIDTISTTTIPSINKTAKELSTDIRTLSDALGRRETRFFMIERIFVVISLISALAFASYRFSIESGALSEISNFLHISQETSNAKSSNPAAQHPTPTTPKGNV